eukprot:gene2084-4073_t
MDTLRNKKGGLYGLMYSTVGIVHDVSSLLLTETQHRLLYVADVAKERYPPAAGTIEFVVEMATLGTDIATSTIDKYYSKGLSATEEAIQSARDVAGDVKQKAMHELNKVKPVVSKAKRAYRNTLGAVENEVKHRMDDVSGAVKQSKTSLLARLDFIITFASHVLVRIPDVTHPYVEQVLNKAQPYVVNVVRISKPFVDMTLVIASPMIKLAQSLADPYVAKVVQTIEKHPQLSEKVDRAYTNAQQVIEEVKAYCHLESSNINSNIETNNGGTRNGCMNGFKNDTISSSTATTTGAREVINDIDESYQATSSAVIGSIPTAIIE